MSAFLFGCALLLALLLPFLLLTWRGDHAIGDTGEANRQWYQLRQRELDNEMDASLVEDARLRLLEDAEQSDALCGAAAAPAEDDSGRFRAWILLPVVIAFSTVIYFLLGAAPDVVITRQLNSLGEQTTPAQFESLVAEIERRSAQRPENLEYTVLLGRFAMEQQDYASAANYFDTLAAAAPGDATALAYAAQASYLAAGRQLSDAARLRAEQALAVDPHQRTALGLLGMASFEQGRYRAAIAYWERLLAVETPGSPSHEMIASVINSARERLGEPVADSGGAGDEEAPSVGVTVQVSLPPDAVVEPAATVFVLARDGAGNSRMPIAVQRIAAGQLPLSLRLDDGNSMAGQKLSSFDSVLVEVQVSPDGTPGAAKATWLGSAGPLAPAASTEPVDIVLQPNPQS